MKFPGWKKDASESHGEVTEYRGFYDYREHPEKSVVKAQFDIHRMMMLQRGERRYLLAKDVRGIPDCLGYTLTVESKGVVSVAVTRIDKGKPVQGMPKRRMGMDERAIRPGSG